MRICFFTKYEVTWGSSRNRIGAYLGRLRQRGHAVEVISCIPQDLSLAWIGGKGRRLSSVKFRSFWYGRILKHLKLMRLIMKAREYDRIVIQKLNLLYPLLWLLRRRNRNLIFDFDDLCFWDLKSALNAKAGIVKRFNFWRKGLQHPKALRLYGRVIAGNRNLAQIARAFRSEEAVAIIPTPVDCRLYSPQAKEARGSSVVIGWSGTGENHLRHLELLVEPFKALKEEGDFIFELVGAMNSKRIKAMFGFMGPRFHCVEWVEATQLPRAIRTFDIGLMPLVDDEEARAKCGFKALEYMASGVCAVVSPVGINKEIVKDGVNGFLAEGGEEWRRKLLLLMSDAGLRERVAHEGRKTVEESYSLDRTCEDFVGIIEGPFAT